MARKMHEKRPEEDNRYHDTWKLLKKYRDVTWSLEVSVRQVKNQFRIDYDCSIEDFLDSIYMAGQIWVEPSSKITPSVLSVATKC